VVSLMLYQELAVWKRLDQRTAVRFRCLMNLTTKKVSVQSADYYHPGDEAKHRVHLENSFVELFCETDPAQRSGGFDSVEEAVAAFEQGFARESDD